MNATCSHDFSKRVLMARIRWKPFVAAFAVLVVTLAIAVGPIIQDVNAKRRADVAAGEAAFWTSCASAAALVHLVASSTLSRTSDASSLFSAQGAVTRQNFNSIATALRPNFALKKPVVLQAYDLIWAPIVHHANRSALEAGITAATGQAFTIGKRNPDFSRVSAPNADMYLPVLDQSVSTFPSGVLFWGMDLLNQPDINDTVRQVITTKQASFSVACFLSPFVRPVTKDSCYPQHVFAVVPIFSLSDLPTISASGTPYDDVVKYLYRSSSANGDVIGVLLSKFHPDEAITLVAARIPSRPGSSSDRNFPLLSWFLEDVTDVPDFAKLGCDSNAEARHDLPFGSGMPVFLYPVDTISPLIAGGGYTAALYYTTHQPTFSHVVCAGPRVWNLAISAPQHAVESVETNEASAALRTDIIVTALIGAVVAFCVFVASYYIDVLRYVEDYDLTERQAEVDSYEKTMVYACDELEHPLKQLWESAKVLKTSLVNQGTSIDSNLDILTLSCGRMSSRLQCLRAVAEERAGKMHFDDVEFEVRPFIVEVAAMHRSFGVVPIHWQVDANVPDRVIAAQVGVEQILANGLTNSCKFCTDEIAGWIRIHVKYYEDGGDPCLEVCVIDNGCGLGGKAPEQFFETFNAGAKLAFPISASPSNKRNTPKTRPIVLPSSKIASSGLGLSFSRRVARSLRGDVMLFERDRTTNFVLRLPVKLPSELDTSRNAWCEGDGTFGGSVLPLLASEDEHTVAITATGHRPPGFVRLSSTGDGTLRPFPVPKSPNPLPLPAHVVPDVIMPRTHSTGSDSKLVAKQRSGQSRTTPMPASAHRYKRSSSGRVFPGPEEERQPTPPEMPRQTRSVVRSSVSELSKDHSLPPLQSQRTRDVIEADQVTDVDPAHIERWHSCSNPSVVIPRSPAPLVQPWCPPGMVKSMSVDNFSFSRGATAHASPMSSSRLTPVNSGKPPTGVRLSPIVRPVIRVLLYEPDPIVAVLIENWDPEGFAVVAIGNLAAVRSCLERSGDVGLAKDPKDHGVWQPFDAVFLEADDKLSEHAVIQAVKELQEDGCSVPFVAVTSDRTAKTKRRFTNAGFKDVLIKPYTESSAKDVALRMKSMRTPWISPARSASVGVKR